MRSDIDGGGPSPPVAWQLMLPVGSARRVRTLEHVAIYLDVLLEVRRHILFRKDRRHRTLGLARAAIDAFIRVDVELFRSLVDAVDRADVDAGAILGVLAGFSYYVGHVFPENSAPRNSLPRQAIPLRKIDPLHLIATAEVRS